MEELSCATRNVKFNTGVRLVCFIAMSDNIKLANNPYGGQLVKVMNTMTTVVCENGILFFFLEKMGSDWPFQ